jgi:hypothetical protein
MGSNTAYETATLHSETERSSRHALSATLRLLVIAAVVRAVFIWSLPEGAVSRDLAFSWTVIAKLLAQGRNPYAETMYLNYPPLWVQILYGLQWLCSHASLPWLRTFQVFTATLDVLGLWAAATLLARDNRAMMKALFYGWALNPTAVLLSCQHCNFDGLVVLWCVLGLGSLLAFERSKSAIDWTYACLFIGLGVLTKIVPIVLTSLLAGYSRPLDMKTRGLGILLAFGPVALGLSAIYVLAPAGVSAAVLAYRSVAGYYGISGLLNMYGHAELGVRFGQLFQVALLTAGAWLALRVWRGQLRSERILLAPAFLFLFIPTFGPGYGPQYAIWSAPFLALVTTFASVGCRRVVLAQLVVTALTLVFEYGLFPSHGAAWLHGQHSQWLSNLSDTTSTLPGQTLLRLPTFVLSIASLVFLAREVSAGEAPNTEHTLTDAVGAHRV